jgi:peptide/nickel transport system permease protein
MRRLGYLPRKLLQVAASVFAVASFNFLLFHLIPGDPIRLIARTQKLDAESVAQLRQQFGLDGSLIHQYFVYLNNLAHGDLGYSFALHEPVGGVLIRALGHTALLLTCSTLLVVLGGVAIGVYAGSRHGTRKDSAVVITSLALWSMPTFWVAMLLAFAFGVWWGVLPVSGITTPNAVYGNYFVYVVDIVRHLVLPTLTLALVDIAFFVLVARTALVEVMHEDYMLTARGKGLPRRRLVWRHGVRNALLPVLTASALYISALVGGAIQVEVVYSWPGMGLLMYNSVLARDYPVLEATFLVSSVVVLLANFASDVLYRVLDPRVAVAQ